MLTVEEKNFQTTIKSCYRRFYEIERFLFSYLKSYANVTYPGWQETRLIILEQIKNIGENE